MALEDEDMRGHENWAHVSRAWYFSMTDLGFQVRRLYRHLVVLARSNLLQQPSLYHQSLINALAPISARDAMRTLFGGSLPRGWLDGIRSEMLSMSRPHG